MKLFRSLEQDKAAQHAKEGGQALHLHRIIIPGCPKCFSDAVKRGEDIAHLFDQDEARLRRTVRALGVNVVAIGRKGEKYQHVDLCGGPLKKAIAMCKEATGGRLL